MARVAGSSVPAAAGAVRETQGSGPVAARRFAVQHALEVNTKFETVVFAVVRKIVGKRRPHIIVSNFAPAGKPVDERRGAGYAREVRNVRNGSQLIVFRE